MTKLQDFFTKEFKETLSDPTNGFFGEAIITYEFTKNRNVQNLSQSNSYNVKTKVRVLSPGIGVNMNSGNPDGFADYPVYLQADTSLRCTVPNVTATLKRMFPRTLNSSVETNSNTSDGSTKTRSNEHTNGSSSSNINTFGVQAGLGFFGDMATGNVEVDYSHSWESGHSKSNTSGTGYDSSQQAASGTEMSIKDWSSYGAAKNLSNDVGNNTIGETSEWVWAQSYPWDVIQFHQLNGTSVQLPTYVLNRLQIIEQEDGTPTPILQPPSHLSLFGIDFTMMAEWEVTFPGNLTSIETLDIHHNFSLLTATHTSGTDAPTVTLNTDTLCSQSIDETNIDLGQYALAPLKAGSGNGAGIGFRNNLFDVQPSATQTFKIVSQANNILVTGSGFEEVMTTSFSNTAKNATFTIIFKTADLLSDFRLLLRHWIAPGSSACKLSCLINDIWTEEVIVDQSEGRGAQNNMSSIELRNLDLSSVNYHDYLVVGTNKIVITVTPETPTNASNQYTLSALAITDSSD
ncbi:hypothetical protein SAMN02744133_12024 [Thalassospira xiamenensis M-5 = DSM 17429]|uniref:Uncharacterized protein n=1 Tax=Thalassospira xiamenensis M-5 = DSM 17429 TaxID=1123366 RepID=A0AB72UBS7_9PROT|nr:hypothetical protein [Thalassospira xiamenensis]AJD51615.1 hypothetical protein TH3_07475 [Thalassospira xiamenensis M-5 = DSM 17429]SIT31633.1 hypothetical protein SAMN02744133_12024 [Thalassospira xiamenensis M-5 = DSM 17429]